MSDKAYRMKADRVLGGELKARTGDTVYPCTGWDYGCANDDTAVTGIEHTSVTLKPNGDYPFFTVPKQDLEPVSL
jgi:hypothetical protein